jgi:hypothetical protein
MPFFHIAIDIVDRDWLTVEAPDINAAYRWGSASAAAVYKKNNHVHTKDVEFGNEIEPALLEEEKYHKITARLDGNGKEIENAK